MTAPRWYRLLLRCYPRPFRERFGREMEGAFLQQRQACRSRARRVALYVAVLRDAMVSGGRERAEEALGRLRRGVAGDDPGRPAVLERPMHPPPTEPPMYALVQDLRFAMRSLRRRPAFAVAVVTTLALGIGANTAVFSLVDAVLLRPVAIERPDEVVAVYRALSPTALHQAAPYPEFSALATRSTSFSGIAGWTNVTVAVRTGDRASQLVAAMVSGNYFRVLGIHAQLGRLLLPDDTLAGAEPAVVLSDQVWAQSFRRDPHVLGSTLPIGGTSFTIVGVAPAGFRGTELSSAVQLWAPLPLVVSVGAGGLYSGRMAREIFRTTAFGWVRMIGRLRPGATIEAATSESNRIISDFQREAGIDVAARGEVANPISLVPVTAAAALADRANLLRFIGLLLSIVGLTLLIACANVANLLLVHAARRGPELAIRSALGASRYRLVRTLLCESLLLAAGGAAAAMLVGIATMHLLSTFTLPGDVPIGRAALSLNLRVLGFTGAVATLSALLFGLVPSLRGSRASLGTLAHARRGTGAPGLGGVLVAAQVGMSVLLVVGAALFVRSVRAGFATDLGFRPEPLAAVTVNLQPQGYDAQRAAAYFDDAEARARAIPGVTGAAVASQVPLAPMIDLPFGVMSGQGAGSDRQIRAGADAVSPSYFDVLGMPIIAGRAFSEADDARGTKVAILNETAARLLSPQGSPLGDELRLLGSIRLRVVGVVQDTKYESVRDTERPVVFLLASQQGTGLGSASIVTRSRNPRSTLIALRRAVAGIDGNVPVLDARLVGDQIAESLMPQRFGAVLLGVFALVAVALASVGIYGVVAYGVSQRTAEIGIRLALGARPSDVVRVLTVRVGLAVLGGATAGIAAGLAGTRVLARFLYGVAPLDPVSFGSAVVVLAAVAAVAGWWPTRRALAVDPTVAMRTE